MSPEKQRIAIAKALGKDATAFRFMRKGYSDKTWMESPHYSSRENAEYWRERESHWGETQPVEPITSAAYLPNYLNDLNAIHSAVAYFVELRGFPFQQEYTRTLRAVVKRRRRDCNEMQIDFWMAEADPAQRCEPLLKALNLWQETPTAREEEKK